MPECPDAATIRGTPSAPMVALEGCRPCSPIRVIWLTRAFVLWLRTVMKATVDMEPGH